MIAMAWIGRMSSGRHTRRMPRLHSTCTMMIILTPLAMVPKPVRSLPDWQCKQRHDPADDDQISVHRVEARERHVGAPIAGGSMNLLSVIGISDTRKNHTMITPCSVNRLL